MLILMSECTQAEHEEWKSDHDTFRAKTSFVGYQRAPDDSGGRFMELRTCYRCGSTLTLIVDKINHDWVLLTGAMALQQLHTNAELSQEEDTDDDRRSDVLAARRHMRHVLAMLRRHLPEGLR
jgi:hypothetical protein